MFKVYFVIFLDGRPLSYVRERGPSIGMFSSLVVSCSHFVFSFRVLTFPSPRPLHFSPTVAPCLGVCVYAHVSLFTPLLWMPLGVNAVVSVSVPLTFRLHVKSKLVFNRHLSLSLAGNPFVNSMKQAGVIILFFLSNVPQTLTV